MPILHWLTRSADIEAASQVQYRVLEEVDSLHYGDKNSGNLLIQGDNLDALKALLPYYAGQVKCIYIDPPYNSGNAFDHYDDNLEHTLWLSIMYSRLELLRDFLHETGSIWIQIDDDECHYLKVICDEIFGRANFVNMISVNMKNIAGASGGGEDKKLKKNCEYILIYAKNYSSMDIFRGAYKYEEIGALVERYREEDISWKYTTALVNPGQKIYLGATVDGNGEEISIYRRENFIIKSVGQLMKENSLSEREVYQKYAKCLFQTAMPQSSIRPRVMEKVKDLRETGELFSIEYVPRSGRNKGLKYEQFYRGESFRLFAWLRDVSEEKEGILYKKTLLGTYWDFASDTKNLTKEGSVEFPNGKKPEALVSRIFSMTTSPGDLVMDTFLGSGTTAAVAHKMGRRYIGVEMGEHCVTHCQPRLVKVVDGEQGGISKSQNWTGGGGFRFYRLGAPLFNEEGLISREVTFKNLSAHIWFSETYSPIATGRTDTSAILGVHDDVAYVVLHPESSSTEVLTSVVLCKLKDELELQGYSEVKKIVVYGESCRMGDDRLREQGVVFKQIPYDVKAR